VSWVKEEVAPEIRSISALMAKHCPAIEGVMGGNAVALYDHRHATRAKGNPRLPVRDLIQRIWDLLDGGQGTEAGDLF
jgi:hypothetical protein